MRSLFLAVAFAWCCVASAATVTGFVSCDVRSALTNEVLYSASDSSSCVDRTFSFTEAFAEYSEVFDGNEAALSVHSLATGAGGWYSTGNGQMSSSYATAMASVDVSFAIETGGRSRRGILRYKLDSTAAQTNGGRAEINVASDYLDGSCAAFEPGFFDCPGSGEVEVPLGVEMEFTIGSMTSGSGDTATSLRGETWALLQLSFFEMDGVTPVLLTGVLPGMPSGDDPGVEPVPEPSSALLAASALGLAAAALRRRRAP